jgi:hypothetical protein
MHHSITPPFYCSNHLAATSALLSRALRRFAAFSWMIPRLAALSIAETRARICSGLAVCEEPAVFCIVRRRVRTLRLRSDRFTVWRARLAADLVLAIVNQKRVDVHARERVAIVNSQDFPDSEHAPSHKWRIPVPGIACYNRLFNASFAFCRWAASAPRIRIWSTESVAPEA